MSNLPTKIDDGDLDDLLEELPQPVPRWEIFCKAFADPESASYGRATKSAVAAGYESEPHQAAWRLRQQKRVILRIEEFQAAAMAKVGKVFSDLENQRLLALEKGDIQAANRASELQGKHLAMFTDRVVVEESPMGFDPALVEAASALGMTLLERAGCRAAGLPVIEADEPKLLEPKPVSEPERK
jgi:phage terminase small subunit